MSLSPKKLILLGLAAILLIAIPLTVFLAQKQQETRSGAAPASRLSFDKESNTVALNGTVSLDVKLDPGQGDAKNLVGEMQLTINYDADKLELTDTKFTPNQSVISESTPPEYGAPVNGIGTISVAMKTVTTCDNITCEISTNTTIATLKFKAIKVTSDTPAKVSFDPDPAKTLLLSGGVVDTAGGNVLLSAGEANITVTDAAVSPTVTPTLTPTPTTAPSGPANQLPACSNISLDKAAAGTAPYDLTFTAAGTDSDGAISKATFSFGDGITQDVTEGGGIGTSTVSAQLAHTYSSAGTFNASITFTDNAAGVSPACTQTVTISGSAEPTSPPVVATATPIPTLAPTGPAETLMGIGAFGILFTIIGAAVLLIL